MSAIPMAITAQDVAKGLSMFEIDEPLEALVEAAEQEAEANNGELSEDIKTALGTYAEAFGYKVDRIANGGLPTLNVEVVESIIEVLLVCREVLHDLDLVPADKPDDQRFVVGTVRSNENLTCLDDLFELLPERFTLSELQALTEAILGETLDRRNFRRRVQELGLVEPATGQRRVGSHRPAQLFRAVQPRSRVTVDSRT